MKTKLIATWATSVAMILAALACEVVTAQSNAPPLDLSRVERIEGRLEAIEGRSDEIVKKSDAAVLAAREAGDKSIAAAKENGDKSYNQATLIMALMGAFLTLLTVLAIVGGYAGWREFRQLREARSSAQTKFEELRAACDQSQNLLKAISTERVEMLEKWSMGEGQYLVLNAIQGAGSINLSPDLVAKCEDLDTMALVADQLLAAKPSSAVIFVDLSRFWRASGRHNKAKVRVERALEIDPKYAAAHHEKAKVLSQWAARDRQRGIAGSPGATRLAEAMSSLELAVQLDPRDMAAMLHTRAWIEDEQGDFNASVSSYRQAITLDESKAAAGVPIDGWLRFNAACALSKAGQLEDAMTLLEKHPEFWVEWGGLLPDEDFKNVKEGLQTVKRFASFETSAMEQAEKK